MQGGFDTDVQIGFVDGGLQGGFVQDGLTGGADAEGQDADVQLVADAYAFVCDGGVDSPGLDLRMAMRVQHEHEEAICEYDEDAEFSDGALDATSSAYECSGVPYLYLPSQGDGRRVRRLRARSLEPPRTRHV